MSTLLLGGRFDKCKVTLSREPQRIEVGGLIYDRINDPDTGEGLGAYVLAPVPESTHPKGTA